MVGFKVAIPKARSGLGLALAFGVGLTGLWSSPVNAAPDSILSGAGVPMRDAEVRGRRFADGVEAYDRGEFNKAYDIWLPLAQSGDLAARRNIGHLFRHGRGVRQDKPRALAFYQDAGRAGLVSAQLNAAFMHLNGEGTDADATQAAFWFHMAAAAGAPIAQYNLGLMYEGGRGVDADVAKSLGWYALAARAGHELALDRLAELVMELPGPEEPVTRKPASAQSSAPEPVRPSLPQARSAVASRPQALNAAGPAFPPATEPQIDTREDQSVVLVSEDQGRLFMEGKFLYDARDYDGAAQIWGALANQGVQEAQYRYGQLLASGLSEQRDVNLAYQWLARAAAQGHTQAAQEATQLRQRYDGLIRTE